MKEKYRVIECSVCGHLNIFPVALFRREPFPVSEMIKQKYCKHIVIGHGGIICRKNGVLAFYPFRKAKNILSQTHKSS